VAAKLFRNVQVVRVDGNAGAVLPVAQPVSFLANVFSNTVSWSPDGTFMLFDTGQRTESFQVARIDLIPRTPRFREDQFRDLFREETPRNLTPPQRDTTAPTPTATPTPAATPIPSPSPATSEGDERKKPHEKKVEITFEGIRQRLSLLPIGIDVNYQAISPDGKWVVLIASAAGQQNLYAYSLDELAREPAVPKQLTSTPGFKGLAQFSPDGKEIFYLDQGRINAVTLEGKTRPLAVAAEMDVDFGREKMEVFRQVWTYLHEHFYDPNFHGVNWAAMRDAYEPRIAGARTPDEMRRLLQLMVGELNASHSGVSAPFTGATAATGRLGLRFDRVEYETTGRLRVTEIIPLSPAALARELKAGDYLVAVDGREINARTNLDELLNYKINRRVSLRVAPAGMAADGAPRRELAVRPVNAATEKALLYRKWVEDNRAYVARVSNGRLGYVHMPDMSAGSLTQLYADLDAENQAKAGVVVDVRNNNGGFVNAYALDVFARRPYLTMRTRGRGPSPARAVTPDSGETHLADVRQITFGGENAEAYFSHDGRSLTFQSTRDGRACDQQYVVNVDGTGLARVSDGRGKTTCGWFLPGDQRLFFASTSHAGADCPRRPDPSKGYVWGIDAFDLYTAGRDGSGMRRLTSYGVYTAEGVLSPDGRRIVFTSLKDGDLDIYTMNVDGTDVRRLTTTPGYDGGPWWSPDGTKIVYRAWHYAPGDTAGLRAYQELLGQNAIRPNRMELFVMNADGSDQRQITRLGGANFGPSWAPGGRRIVFSSNHKNPRSRNFDLYLVNLDGTGLEQVTTHGEFDGFPMFSPDGKTLVWASNRFAAKPGDTNLFLADWRE